MGRAERRYPLIAHPLSKGQPGHNLILRAQAQRVGRDQRRAALSYLGRVRRS